MNYAYNEMILHLWKANMDLQYILDPYACVVYVVSYIGKAQRGMSKLLKDAMVHYKAGDTTIKERLRGIAHKFQNCTEISAQEVSYHLLSQSCTRAEIRNAGPPRGPHFFLIPARGPQLNYPARKKPAQIFSSLLKRNYICKRLNILMKVSYLLVLIYN